MDRRLQVWGALLFFFSGMTGLVYEILWTRRLNLTFGHSILAVSTVVTAYMGGLALGSALGGRWSDARLVRGQKAAWFLSTYGSLEAFVGVWALLSLPLLGLVEKAYLELSSRGLQGLTLYILAFLGSLFVLLPPTTAMGATLPVVSCLYQNSTEELGKTLSRLYSTNTFGALVGVALAGFVLLPHWGLVRAIEAAALVNFLIAAVAWWASRGLKEQLQAEAAPEQPGPNQPIPWVLVGGFALTGVLSMSAQMAWTRSLSLSLGSSVYAFSIILIVFLGGLALGSALFSWLARGRQLDWTHLAALWTALGLTSAAVIPLLGYLPQLFIRGFHLAKDDYRKVLVLDLGLSAVVLIVPTTLMGLGFPLVTQIYHKYSGQLARSVGYIYSANTLGCILGSFLAGFVLIPRIGVQTTLEASAAGSLLLAAVYLAQAPTRRGWAPLLGMVGLAVFAIPSWNTAWMSAGVATHGSMMRGDWQLSKHRPLYHRDGLSGTVSVLLWGNDGLTLRVNGKPEASFALPDRTNQTLLGLLAYFYVPEPKEIGVIGLGSGLTLTAMARMPGVVRAECAELEPYVIEAEKFWRCYNDKIVLDPRVRNLYADGRTMIMGSPHRYDALVSVPSNPWVAGVGNLYTVDFYRSVRSKLNPGGAFVQWVNLYSLSPADLDVVLRTFSAAFPKGQLWALGGDLALVGTDSQAQLQGLQKYYRDSPYLRYELAELSFLKVEQLAGCYLCPLEFALARVPKGPINSDDLPCLEYSAPFSMYSTQSFAANMQRVLTLQKDYRKAAPGLPGDQVAERSYSIGTLAFSRFRDLRSSLDPQVSQELADYTRNLTGRPLSARLAWLKQHPQWEEARIWLAELGSMSNYSEKTALAPADLTQRPEPERYIWLRILAEAALEKSQWKQALEYFDQLKKMRSLSTFDSAASDCLWRLKRWPEARERAEAALSENALDPRARTVLARCLMQDGQADQALKILTRVVNDCPFQQEAWMLRAQILGQQGQDGALRGVLEEYLDFFPDDEQIRNLKQQLN